MGTNSGMNGGKVRPSRVEEAPLGAAVEMAPVRLTPAAAERVAMATAMGHCRAVYQAEGKTMNEPLFVSLWKQRTHEVWIATAGAAVESALAELRLAGWTVAPPGQPGAAGPLKGGV